MPVSTILAGRAAAAGDARITCVCRFLVCGLRDNKKSLLTRFRRSQGRGVTFALHFGV